MPLVVEHANCNIIIRNNIGSVSYIRYSKFRIRTGSTQTTVVRNPVDRIYSTCSSIV